MGRDKSTGSLTKFPSCTFSFLPRAQFPTRCNDHDCLSLITGLCFLSMPNSQSALPGARSWVMFLTGNARRTKTTWHHERASLCLAPSMHHFLTLTDMLHPGFLHQEYTHSIHHQESDYYTSTLEIIGGQSGRKSSFSQDTGSPFPRGGKECITTMGETRPSLSCHPHHGRSKCYRGCDDEPRVWYSMAGQEVMRPRRWKTEKQSSQTALRWIGYYIREESDHYLRRHLPTDCSMPSEH